MIAEEAVCATERPFIAVVLFAGGGGSTRGIEGALGIKVMVAINHCHAAIEMHETNHPDTIHYEESVFTATAETVVGLRHVNLMWASPDCRDFSNAKNGVPVSKEIRSLAWVVIDWIQDCRPPVILLENVREFQKWGPVRDGKKVKERRGYEFCEFITALGTLGYEVEWRELVAADFDTPTSRKRLYLVARCDGQAIHWPEPTNGPGRARPHRAVAECIDWTIPVKSIFGRKKPLAEATQRRIAEGIRRYVLSARKPFLVCLTHQGSDRSRAESIDEPLKTITTATRGERAVIVPTLVNTRNGERKGQAPRVRDIEKPMPTVTAKGSQGAFVAAFLARHNGTTEGKMHPGLPLTGPAGAITTVDTHGLAAVFLERTYSASRGQSVEVPLGAITQVNHSALVAAFLIRYYGSGGQWSALDEPMATVVTKARMGLVTVEIDGEEWALVDIGMRMLTPRELARAQGFPDSHVLTGTKAEQIARIGNSVCPPVAEALVRAQFPELAARVA